MDEKIEFGKRFSLALQSSGLDKKPQSEIGKILGVSGPMISNYLNGIKTPSGDTCRRMSRKLGVNYDWLNMGRGSMKYENLHSVNEEKIDYGISSATHAINIFPLIGWEDVIFSKELYKDMFKGKEQIQSTHEGEDCFFLEVQSENLSPEINPGDRVLIDQNEEIKHNDYIVVLKNGSPIFRKAIFDGKDCFLKSTNPSWPNKIEQLDASFTIVGVAVEVTRRLRK